MESKISHPFGELIVQERKRIGLTQYALAKRLNKNTRELAIIEKGLREPRFSTLMKVAEALEIPVGVLAEKLAEAIHKQEADKISD